MTTSPVAAREPAIAPPRALSLRANFSWTFVGNVVYAACQWAMLVVLAKLGSPETVGQFALGLAITAPVIMLTNLQLRSIQATDARRAYRFGHYLGLRLAATPVALLVIVAITFASQYGWQTALVVLAVGMSKVFESISDVFYGLLQQHEQMDRIAKSMMLKGPLSLIALGAAILLTGNIVWGATALAAVWALLLVAYDLRNGRAVLRAASDAEPDGEREIVRPIWDWRRLGKLTWLALPLGVVMMLASLTTNIPRYFIERFAGERELGIFAAMVYIMVAGTTVVDALGQAVSPRLSRQYADGAVGAFRALLGKLLCIGAALGAAGVVVGTLIGGPVLRLLYRPEYAEHLDVFMWILIATGISYLCSVFGYAMTAAQYFTIQVPIFVVSIIVVTVACALLVPNHGILGAAWATCLMFASQLPMKGFAVLRALRARTASAGFGT